MTNKLLTIITFWWSRLTSATLLTFTAMLLHLHVLWITSRVATQPINWVRPEKQRKSSECMRRTLTRSTLDERQTTIRGMEESYFPWHALQSEERAVKAELLMKNGETLTCSVIPRAAQNQYASYVSRPRGLLKAAVWSTEPVFSKYTCFNLNWGHKKIK